MNIDMKESIKTYVEAGGKLIAYGGGLMYLAEKFQGHNMAGIFKGSAQMTDRLQNFGYCELKAKEDLGFAKAGEILRAREFHHAHDLGYGRKGFTLGFVDDYDRRIGPL